MRIEPHTLGSGQRAPLGLALGGGVARGWAHIGAMRALIEAGIKPDIIAAKIIGAVHCHVREDGLNLFTDKLISLRANIRILRLGDCRCAKSDREDKGEYRSKHSLAHNLHVDL